MLRYNQYDQVIHTAMAGQGIAIGRRELIAPMLADGRLAALPGVDVQTSPYAYWLVRFGVGDGCCTRCRSEGGVGGV